MQNTQNGHTGSNVDQAICNALEAYQKLRGLNKNHEPVTAFEGNPEGVLDKKFIEDFWTFEEDPETQDPDLVIEQVCVEYVKRVGKVLNEEYELPLK